MTSGRSTTAPLWRRTESWGLGIVGVGALAGSRTFFAALSAVQKSSPGHEGVKITNAIQPP